MKKESVSDTMKEFYEQHAVCEGKGFCCFFSHVMIMRNLLK